MCYFSVGHLLLFSSNPLFSEFFAQIESSKKQPPPVFCEKVFAANWFCPPCADCVKSYQTPVWEQKVRFIQGLADEQEQPDMNVLC